MISFNKKLLHKACSMLLCTTISISPLPTYAAGGMQGQLNGLFDAMTNVTAPNVFETQRRGVISGGRATMKNKMFNENIINFTPPSWKGGCGGIDLFGGSFSFINSEQLTQLLRAVAAQAISYAFMLAIKNICEQCANLLETLQKKIQELNQFMGNSCQLAQGLVNDLTSGMDLKHKTQDSLVAQSKGFIDDFLAVGHNQGESTTEAIAKNAPELLKTGNIVWQQMKRSNTASWFRIQGDNQLLESIMSITGSVIIQEPGDEGADEDTQTVTEVPGNKLGLDDLVAGGNMTIYSCAGDTDKCMKPSNQNVSLIGLKTQIEAVFLGGSNLQGDGLIGKYSHNQGTLTATEAAISSNLDLGLGAMLFNLATMSESEARSFVMQFSGAIASHMAYVVALESLRAAQAALAGEDSAYIIKVQDTLTRSRQTVESQYKGLTSQYGNIAEAVALYNDLIINVRQSQYAPSRDQVNAE